jgi:suppressor of G2 allele of SKP1
MDEAQRGANALSASDFPAAIQHFTRALLVNPHATDYYIKRSTAYSRLRPADGGPNLRAALHDAEMAVALGMKRARRELILAAQMRRAITLFQFERFGDASFLFDIVRSKVGQSPGATDTKGALESAMATSSGKEKKSKNQELDIWELKVKGRLDKLEAGDEKAVVTVKEIPDIVVPNEKELKEVFRTQLPEYSTASALASEADAETAPSVSSPAAGEGIAADKGKDLFTPNVTKAPKEAASVSEPSTVAQEPVASKVRYEWYQTTTTVVVTIYAKGVPRDKVEVEIQERSVGNSNALQICDLKCD